MVNQTIMLILEELQDEVFIKPSSICSEKTILNNKSAPFNPSHFCEGTSCDCILQLKELNINMTKVVHLNLTKCSLTSLPDSLCELPLKSLNLSHNLLNAVPNCIFRGLHHLENLNLADNNLREFETEPKCVLNLQVLDLRNNMFKYIPIWIIHVKSMNLIELYYTNNALGKTTESLYSKVYPYMLKKMILQSSYIMNENIPFIKSIQTLQVLDVSNDGSSRYRNVFTDYEAVFDNPAWKNNIEILNLSQLTMAFLPDNILSLTSLKELYLSENSIVWLPDHLGNLVNLEILDISRNCLCFLPKTISGLKKLCILNLQHNKLSDVNILNSLMYLEILDLYENELDWFELNFDRYKYVDLERNYFETNSLNDKTYVEKRESYREKYNLKERIIGCYEESSETVSSPDCEPKSYFSDWETNVNAVPDNCYEEECWDDEKIKSHPDVTSSDDEWLGYIPIQQKIKQPEQNLDHLLENLYTDVD